MKIKVTQEHIDQGRDKMLVPDPRVDAVLFEQVNPVALAIKTTKIPHVIVSQNTIQVYDENWTYSKALTPPMVKKWLVRFYTGKKVKPFTFDLALIPFSQGDMGEKVKTEKARIVKSMQTSLETMGFPVRDIQISTVVMSNE